MLFGRDVIQSVSRYLTDYDETDPVYQYVEWSKKDLLGYWRQALAELALAMPAAFRKRVDIAVPADGFVDLPTECQGVLSVVGYIDAYGKLVTQIRQRPIRAGMFAADRPVCAPTGNQQPGVAIDAANRQLFVDNPNAAAKLVINCCAPPTDITADTPIEVEAKYRAALEWWMISMAFGTDIESGPMRERSDIYWRRGYDTLGIGRTAQGNKQ